MRSSTTSVCWGSTTRRPRCCERAQAVDPTAPDEEQQLDAIVEQEELLELERDRSWAAYGEAIMAHIQDAAARKPGLTVPVQIRVDLHTFRDVSELVTAWGISEQLVQDVVAAVPVPVLRQPE